MSETRLALVSEIGVCVCRRAHGLVERIAFTSDGSAAETTDAEEPRLAEGHLDIRPQRCRRGAGAMAGAGAVLLPATRVDAEEVPQPLGKVAVAIRVLDGRHPK